MRTLPEIISKVRSYQAKTNPQTALESFFGKGGISTGDKATDKVLQHAEAAVTPENSLSEFTSSANVEPRAMVEETLSNLPQLNHILMALTNIYAAYYLQSIALSATVGKVSVVSRLDRFNPNRKADIQGTLKTLVEDSMKPATESFMNYGYKLPNYKTLTKSDVMFARPSKLALEAANAPAGGNQQPKKDPIEIKGTLDVNMKQPPAKSDISQGLKHIADMDNLAVGRLLSVDVVIDGKAITVPVAVRVRPMSVPKLIIRELVALGDIRESWKERWHRMRSGELSLVSDWIFQSDIIKKKRELMKLDKQGLYKEMLKRRRDNRLAAAVSGNVSIGSASSYILITEETAREVEARTGMPITSVEFRNRIFAENSAFMILVFDVEWERIRVYTRGLSGEANYTFKQFENMGKGNGPDIMDIMKAYTQNSLPRF